MRVISQDGTMDVPYENVVLYQDEKEIMCIFSGKYIGRKLAQYSTEKKAKKAMEILRIAYENNEFYHHTANSEHFTEFTQALSEEMFKKSVAEYFQFPTEKELE